MAPFATAIRQAKANLTQEVINVTEQLCPDIENLPLVLKVEDLMKLLSIGRCTAYELVRSGQIRSVRLDRSYRIPREALSEYLRKTS